MSDDKQEKVSLTEDLDVEGSSADDVIGGMDPKLRSRIVKNPFHDDSKPPSVRGIAEQVTKPPMPRTRKSS